MKAVKIKMIVQNIEVEWKCPECGTVNNEWVYDYRKGKVLYCCHCGECFKGEFNVNL